MSKTQNTEEQAVTRFDEPAYISFKLRFLAFALNNLQYAAGQMTDDECAGLNFLLSEIADVVRTFENGAA